LADDHRAGGGALYRLDRDGGTELILDGLTMSNGLGWSIDGSTMYLVDSGPRVIHSFAFDAERGTIADGRILVTVAEDVGAPDTMTVDADGDLWCHLQRRARPTVFLGWRASRGTVRPGRAEHLLCVRGPWAEPALRHHGDRGLERRAAPRRARCRARVPLRHRRTGPAGGAISSEATWWATVAP
jgi:SMP-30/Gluconolactonase/LRE-like region